MKLVIVESPKKCDTIARYLGNDFVVMASQGHVRDLSTRGKGGLGIDIPAGFEPDYIISPKKKEIVAKLASAAKKASEVYLATDPDREGEAISWHLAEVLHLPVETTKRLRFHEITKPAILEAMENATTIDENLVRSQEARRMEDRIIGFRISSLLQRRVGMQSAGRVQSATLAMIVERQEKIEAFVPEEYWTITVKISLEGKVYEVPLNKVDGKPLECKSKEEADAICARIPDTLTISSIAKTEKSIAAKGPLTTSSMQQEAYTRFRFSNLRTQKVAQSLYEGVNINGEHVGLITYMRTDSTRISPNFYYKHAVPFITEQFSEEYVGPLRGAKKDDKVQDAHEAIRPTGTHRTPDSVAKWLTPDEAKLYRLIYNRAMASLMAPKRIESTVVTLSGNGLEFSLKGTRVLFPGFTVLYNDLEEKEAVLPELSESQTFSVSSVEPEQHWTKPEPPYNEASIVKAMEEKGIGRPSTYATTIDTLIKRRYVTATKGVLTPTEDGKITVTVLRKYFPDVVSATYTAEMESTLDKVELGEKSFLQTMNEFYIPFEENFERVREAMYKTAPKPTGENCPVCGSPLVYKRSRKGDEFIGCSNFPSCKYIKKETPESEPTGENCPECGKPLVYKLSKKGEKFIGCSNFPNCRYTASLNGTPSKPKEKPVVKESDYVKPCPRCKNGHLVIKQGKKVKFLGCTNYPRCHYHEWLPKEGEHKE
ncbi:MAG: type I DNA topoisomerase [Candidatus Enteromonas sp.]|nr:type I DNA topoisomerase [Candidatus Enteromonas sp.]